MKLSGHAALLPCSLGISVCLSYVSTATFYLLLICIGKKAMEIRFMTSGQPQPSGQLLPSGQPPPFGQPLIYFTGEGRQLFSHLKLKNIIFVLCDNLQFNIMEYNTTPYAGWPWKKKKTYLTLTSPFRYG